jgi:hypothetical protein
MYRINLWERVGLKILVNIVDHSKLLYLRITDFHFKAQPHGYFIINKFRNVNEMPVYQALPKIPLNSAPVETNTFGRSQPLSNEKETWLILKSKIQQYIAPPSWSVKSRYQVKEFLKITKMIHTGWKKIMQDVLKGCPYTPQAFPYLSTKTSTIHHNKTERKIKRRSVSLQDFKAFKKYDNLLMRFKEHVKDKASRNPLFENVWSNSFNCISSLGSNPKLRRRIRRDSLDNEHDFPINEDMDIDDFDSDHSSQVDDDYSDIDEKVINI